MMSETDKIKPTDFSGISSFVQQLRFLFPEKAEKDEQIREIVEPVLSNLPFYANPLHLSLLLQHKWKVPAMHAYFYAGQLASALKKDIYGGDVSTQNTHMPDIYSSTMANDMYMTMNEIMRASMMYDFMKNVFPARTTPEKVTEQQINSGGGTMSPDKLLSYIIIMQMFQGSNKIEPWVTQIMQSISELSKRIEGMNNTGGVKTITLPDPDTGRPVTHFVKSESDILGYLLALGSKGGNDDEKYRLLVDKALEALKDRNSNNDYKPWIDKIVEIQNDRINDLIKLKTENSTLDSVLKSIDQLKSVGLNIGNVSLDDRIKLLDEELKVFKEKMNLLMDVNEQENRKVFFKDIINGIGNKASSILTNYKDEIKEGISKIFEGGKEVKVGDFSNIKTGKANRNVPVGKANRNTPAAPSM